MVWVQVQRLDEIEYLCAYCRHLFVSALAQNNAEPLDNPRWLRLVPYRRQDQRNQRPSRNRQTREANRMGELRWLLDPEGPSWHLFSLWFPIPPARLFWDHFSTLLRLQEQRFRRHVCPRVVGHNQKQLQSSTRGVREHLSARDRVFERTRPYLKEKRAYNRA